MGKGEGIAGTRRWRPTSRTKVEAVASRCGQPAVVGRRASDGDLPLPHPTPTLAYNGNSSTNSLTSPFTLATVASSRFTST